MNKSLIVPTARELQALNPSDRWDLEDSLDEAQDLLREFNDDELRRWIEEEGKSQTEVAKIVGRTQARISQRCQDAGIEISTGEGTKGGRPRKEVISPYNSTTKAEIRADEVQAGDYLVLGTGRERVLEVLTEPPADGPACDRRPGDVWPVTTRGQVAISKKEIVKVERPSEIVESSPGFSEWITQGHQLLDRLDRGLSLTPKEAEGLTDLIARIKQHDRWEAI